MGSDQLPSVSPSAIRRQIVEEPPIVWVVNQARRRDCPVCGYNQIAVAGVILLADWHVCRRGPDKQLWMIMWGRA